MILSTVRRKENDQKPEKNNSIGFLKDKRRTNVALSRGKCMTIIIGEARLLKSCDTYDELIKYTQSIQGQTKIKNIPKFINQIGKSKCQMSNNN